MLDALGFLFAASEVTDNGMDLVILFDMLKSTFPTHWLFLLDSRLIRIQTCFAEGHYLFFFFFWEEDCYGLRVYDKSQEFH